MGFRGPRIHNIYDTLYRTSAIRIMGSMPAERRLKAETVAVIGAGPSGLAAAR